MSADWRIITTINKKIMKGVLFFFSVLGIVGGKKEKRKKKWVALSHHCACG